MLSCSRSTLERLWLLKSLNIAPLCTSFLLYLKGTVGLPVICIVYECIQKLTKLTIHHQNIFLPLAIVHRPPPNIKVIGIRPMAPVLSTKCQVFR